MMRKVLVLLGLVMFVAGCQNIGHNTSFLLQYKKSLRAYYAFEELSCEELLKRFPFETLTDKDKEDKEIRERFQRCQGELSGKTIVSTLPASLGRKIKESPLELKHDRGKSLAKIYTTNLPLSATDHYDIRTVTNPIRRGDFLNIVINKIHLARNGEVLSGRLDSGEIAVVVTVDDGKRDEPKQVLVAYETSISDEVDLPIKDLIAYSTESYGDEPIRIEVIVLDLDQKENKTSAEVLTTAAAVGATMTPAFAPAISIANEVGKLLINTNKDDIIVKMTFQLYPWKPGDPGRVSDQVGVPKVGVGQYLIINSDKHEDIDSVNEGIVHYRDQLHANWDLNLYKVPVTREKLIELSREVNVIETSKTTVRPWPIPVEAQLYADGVHGMSYLVVTVDKTPVNSAAQIIARADAISRAASGLAKNGRLTDETAKAFTESLDDVKSLVKRIALVSQFYKSKIDPKNIEILFKAYKDKEVGLKETDKTAVYELIRNLLPCVTLAFLERKDKKIPLTQANNIETLESWYNEIKGNLVYDGETGQYKVVRKYMPSREQSDSNAAEQDKCALSY